MSQLAQQDLPLDDEAEPFEPADDAALTEQLEAAESETATPQNVALTLEPLFSNLFKAAIAAEHPADQVLHDYATAVVPNLSRLLGHVAAKGGAFAVKKVAEDGLSAEEVARYSDDQSMRAHLINGLLPTAQVARTLKRWGQMRFVDAFDDTTYRLFCAGYTLHDWLKLPSADAELRAVGLAHHTVNVAVHLPTVEAIFTRCCTELGLDAFLAPLGPLDTYLHDLILIASNTQVKWGVMHNLSALPGLRARRRSTSLATDLATLADYLAYLGRTPLEAAGSKSIRKMLEHFSDDQVKVTLQYHHLADVRGVITSIVNNAALACYAIPDVREPLLYAPTGVVYLARVDAPPAPTTATVADAAIERVRELCGRKLAANLTGFGRAGTGLKYADYYTLFFSPRQFVRLVALAAEKRIAGESVAGKRYASMLAKTMAPDGTDLDLPKGLEVDRIAEASALLVKLATLYAPTFDAEGYLLAQLGVAALRDLVQQINGNKTAGGVPYGWYYAAGVSRQRTPGQDEAWWNERLHTLAAGVAAQVPDTAPTEATGWQELRRYIGDHLSFSGASVESLTNRMQAELARYSNARKSGRGATVVCSLCSSPYSVDEQREAAILFAPQVYTNKQPLHGSKASRHICAVCSVEMMLRQLLMKRGRDSGGNFEKRRLRYLFFYPTYFFTPETLRILRAVQERLKRVSFTTLRKLVLPDAALAADLRPETFQRMRDLMLDPQDAIAPEDDRLFRLRFEDREPITFSFVGLPPNERDAKDAEAWINPAFLALVLPLLLDVKVVASESMLPLFNEATELPETVAFDGAHPFLPYLTQGMRLNLDEVVPALQRLTAAYLIHLDGNAKSGAGGYDYKWHTIPALARNLATSPLYAFHYLARWQRREGLDSLTSQKAAIYLDFIRYLDPKGESMTHAYRLTELYRQFYRAEKLNSNAILRPISVAAKALLEADPRLFADDQALIEVVRGRLRAFVENVAKNRADGRLPKSSTHEDRDKAVLDFSTYLVHTVFREAFGGDRAAIRGKQLNLLKNACEAIYLDAWRKEKAQNNESPEDDEPHEPEGQSTLEF